MLPLNERAAQIMEHLVRCESHGYSQYSRQGDGGKETIYLSDGTPVTIATGDRDCSSAVIDAYRSAGLNVDATYTGNMRNAFVNTGLFVWHPGTSYSAQRGDIYLNEVCHTAMCTHPYGSPEGDILAEFSISENGTIDGQEGDQTGWESHEQWYYNYPWDGILEYVGGDEVPQPEPDPVAPVHPTNPTDLGKVNIQYALKLYQGDWLDTVVNYGSGDEGFAGLPCHSHDSFRATVDKGSIKYRTHNFGEDWSDWYCDGEETPQCGIIDGIQLYYTTPDGYEYQQAYYRSQTTERAGYLSWCCDDGNSVPGYDGWCGIYGEPLDRIQIYIA